MNAVMSRHTTLFHDGSKARKRNMCRTESTRKGGQISPRYDVLRLRYSSLTLFCRWYRGKFQTMVPIRMVSEDAFIFIAVIHNSVFFLVIYYCSKLAFKKSVDGLYQRGIASQSVGRSCKFQLDFKIPSLKRSKTG